MKIPSIFERISEQTAQKTARTLDVLLVVAAAVILTAVLASTIPDFVALVGPDKLTPPTRTTMGEFGDFMGGVLNPILTFLAFVALLLTIVLQQKELSSSNAQFEKSARALTDQHEAQKNQRFEASFFQLMSLHGDVVSAMVVPDPVSSASSSGRDCFRVFYSKLRKSYRKKRVRFGNSKPDAALIGLAYQDLYKEHQLELAHYFRIVYNTMRFIKDNGKDRPYIQLYRAQLSNQELLILYYNCVIGEHGLRMRELAEHFELFDNLSDRLLNVKHAGSLWINPKAFGPDGYAGSKKRTYFLGDLRNAPKTDVEVLRRRVGA